MNLEIPKSDIKVTVKYLNNQPAELSLAKETSVQVPDDHIMFTQKGSTLKQHLIDLIPSLSIDYGSIDDFLVQILYKPIVAHVSPRFSKTNSLGASIKTDDEDDEIIALEPKGMYANFEE